MYFTRFDPSLSLHSSKLPLEATDPMTTASSYNGYAGNGAAAFMNGSNQGSKGFQAPKQQPLFQYHPQPTHPYHHSDFTPSSGMATSPQPSNSHPPSSLPQTFQHMSISQTSPLSTSLAAPNSSAGFDLQDVIAQFQSQPELLKLILTSRAEEDRRRCEEAKLRAKEIDLLLLERDREYFNMGIRPRRSYSNGNRCDDMLLDSPGPNLLKGNDHGVPSMLRIGEASTSTQHGSSFQDSATFHSMSASPSPRGTEFAIPIPIQPQRMRRGSSGSFSSGAINRDRRDSAVGSLCSSVDDDKSSSESVMSSFSPSLQSIHHQPTSPRQSSGATPLAPPSRKSGGDRQQSPDQVVSSPDATQSTEKRKRKRREMQAVTMIIETKEHPHLDNYLWKNNGNTTQKKTGNKSVYYKCSNSNKGCPVNKTVTNKENGTYLIKVRGEHLAECGKVKRIVNT